MVQTPFEMTGVKSSIAAGEDFLEALADAHDHVTLQTWEPQPTGDATRLGMFSVKVGTGHTAAGVIGSIHGNELSGREACFAFARDLAESTDPTIQAYLEDHAWSFMATANPAGVADTRRTNDNSEDLNRDYDLFTQPETQAIDAWLLSEPPVLVMDLHEGSSSDLGAYHVNTGKIPSDTPLTEILAMAVLLNDSMSTTYVAEGYTWKNYGVTNDGTLRKHGHPRYKIVAELIEANNTIQTLGQRIEAHRLGLRTAMLHHLSNAAAYEAAYVADGGTGRPVAETPDGWFIMRGGSLVPVDGFVSRGGGLIPL